MPMAGIGLTDSTVTPAIVGEIQDTGQIVEVSDICMNYDVIQALRDIFEQTQSGDAVLTEPKPSCTIRILSSVEKCCRGAGRMSLITPSADLLP
jgi:hypothetical protein